MSWKERGRLARIRSSRSRHAGQRPALLLALLVTGCGPVEVPAPSAEPGPAVCEAGSVAPVAELERHLDVLGPSVNGVRRFGEDIYIVESGSNTIARLDPASGAASPLVDVGNERSPWDLWATDDELWITNFVANTVTVADRDSGTILAEIRDESFAGPAGITATAERVYVGNTHFRGTGDYGAGSVTVIDLASRTVLGTIATQRQNPQNLDVLEIAGNERVIIVDAGAIAFVDGLAEAGSEAAIELWEETTDPLEPKRQSTILPLRPDDPRVGLPGRPLYAKASGAIYLASATAPALFRFDPLTMEFTRGFDDPIILSEGRGDSLNHAAIDDRGILYVTAFNEDALYLVDTSCDAPLLGPLPLDDTTMLAGPLGGVPVDVGDGRVDLFFVLSLANEVGRMRFRYE